MIFDPTKAMDDAIQFAKQGPSTSFTWRAAEGWHGVDVEELLSQYGVYNFCRSYRKNEMYGILVRKSQVRWAEYVLLRAGAPLTSPLRDPSNRNVKPGPMPTSWGNPVGRVGLAGAVQDRLSGTIKKRGDHRNRARGSHRR